VREFAATFRAAFPDLNFWGTADLIAEATTWWASGKAVENGPGFAAGASQADLMPMR